MPGRDQTGPRGAGPKSGRATGRCATNSTDERGGCGRGMGRGARDGMGRGRAQEFGLKNRMERLEKRPTRPNENK